MIWLLGNRWRCTNEECPKYDVEREVELPKFQVNIR